MSAIRERGFLPVFNNIIHPFKDSLSSKAQWLRFNVSKNLSEHPYAIATCAIAASVAAYALYTSRPRKSVKKIEKRAIPLQPAIPAPVKKATPQVTNLQKISSVFSKLFKK